METTIRGYIGETKGVCWVDKVRVRSAGGQPIRCPPLCAPY